MLALAHAAPASAQTAENVAVVINDASAASRRIGEYYIRQRAIPATNVIHIRTVETDALTRDQFVSTIEQPIAAALSRGRLQDRVLYIVLTKGIPLRISGTAGPTGTIASVDSELTLLYRQMLGRPVPVPGTIDNPYYLAASEVSDARPFSHKDYDIFLVTRLDAFTVDQALALVDKARAPVTDGRIVLDKRVSLIEMLEQRVNSPGDDWLTMAAARLTAAGQESRVVLESTIEGARDIRPVMGYYSWGSNDPQNRVRTVNMGFVPGSLAATFVSSDARTFREPPADWKPASGDDRSALFEGTPQSLIGDLIREGATGVAGHVSEPLLRSTIRPQILFPAYLAGYNLAEAFYLSMPHLSWQTVVVGDPLCAPFPRKSPSRTDLDPGLETETQLPAFFSKRLLAQFQSVARDTPARALVLTIRAEGAQARGETVAARASLEEATQIAPTLVAAQLRLALIYEQIGEHTLAFERYERILATQPGNATALNNLAYGLAVRGKEPQKALPLARRALAAAPGQGTVLDTLAWVEYLNGDVTNAVRHIAAAVARAPGQAEVRLHAAVIQAAAGARAVAQDQLREALRLDPTLESRDEVRDARARIEKLGRQP